MAGTNIGTAFVTIMPSTKGISGSISKALKGEATTAGNEAGHTAGGSLVSTLKKVIGAAAIGKFLWDSLNEGGKLQQSYIGGLETLYGDAAQAAREYADEAYKAGISANDYAEQAVSFGAALKSAYGGDTQQAMEAANKAIMDMADNSAKMGTEIGSVQAAYQGFAKQNYTMLDNLKLGYGGTKTEMERLLADAQKLSGIEYNIDNLGDVYDAIHVIQEDLGLTGVAAEEAAETFSGSMGAMKAAAQNFMGNLSLGQDIVPSLMALGESVSNFLFNNLFPMVGNILSGLAVVIGEGLLTAFREIPGVVDAAIAFLNQLTQGITDGGGALSEKMREIGNAALEMFRNTDWLGLGKAVINLLCTGITTIAPIIWDGLKAIASKAWEWFKSVDWIGLGEQVIDTVHNGITTVGPIIWEKLKEIADRAWEWFKDVDWIGLGSQVIDFIFDGIQSIGHTIWEGLKNIGGTALEWFRDVDWFQVGSDAVNFIVDGILSIGSTIWENLKELASNAIEEIASIDWLGTGSDIVSGIVDGIAGAGWAIIDTLIGFAYDAWNSVLDFFGIGSPSKLMRDTVGRWLPLGIVKGIEEEGDEVAQALDDVAKHSIDDVDASIGLSTGELAADAAAGGIGAGIVINVYPSEGMDERELADRVSDRLNLLLQQEEAVWA